MLMSNPYLAQKYDEAQEAIYKNLKSAGVSKKVLDDLDHVSRPGDPGPNLQDPQAAELYKWLVLQGLSEVAKKQASSAKSSARKKAS
jgi:hypothetical protein